MEVDGADDVKPIIVAIDMEARFVRHPPATGPRSFAQEMDDARTVAE